MGGDGSITTLTAIGLGEIILEPGAWPREALDEERVTYFAELLAEAREVAERNRAGWQDPFPPLVVVVAVQPRGYVLADGRHRYEARRRLGFGFDRPAVAVVTPADGQDPVALAYELALFHATVSAKPLSTSEKQVAIGRLILERPELSDRAIARLVGVSHSTVGAHRHGVVDSTTGPSAVQDSVQSGEAGVLRWEVAARRLAEDVTELLASCRKLFGGPNPARASAELLSALVEQYGVDAAGGLIDDLGSLVDGLYACLEAEAWS